MLQEFQVCDTDLFDLFYKFVPRVRKFLFDHLFIYEWNWNWMRDSWSMKQTMIFPLSRPLRNIHLLIHFLTIVFFILSTVQEVIVRGMRWTVHVIWVEQRWTCLERKGYKDFVGHSRVNPRFWSSEAAGNENWWLQSHARPSIYLFWSSWKAVGLHLRLKNFRNHRNRLTVSLLMFCSGKIFISWYGHKDYL